MLTGKRYTNTVNFLWKNITPGSGVRAHNCALNAGTEQARVLSKTLWLRAYGVAVIAGSVS